MIRYTMRVALTCAAAVCLSSLAGAEELYSCLFDGVSATYRAAEMTRMKALGAVCDKLSDSERVTCAMDGVKQDYSRQEADRVMAANPQAVCEMKDKLVVTIPAAEVKIHVDAPAAPERRTFSMSGKEVVYFNLGSARLTSGAYDVLGAFARKYGSGGYHFTITGYADASGSSRFNHTLSLKRAGRVRDALIDDGISKDAIISVNALGEESLRLRTGNGVRSVFNRAVEVRAYR